MKKITFKSILISVLMIALLTASLFAFTACKDEEPTASISFTYTETEDDVEITGYDGVLAEGETLTIPSMINGKPVKSIAAGAFAKRTDLRTVFVPANLTAIGEGAFEDCENLESVNIPYSIKRIEARTFAGCKSLKSILLTKKVTYIGDEAFYGCKSLSAITVPDSVKEIGKKAFAKCGITTAEIPTFAIEKIDTDKLETLVITGGESIGDGAFAKCKALKSVYIPVSVMEIAENAFEECNGIENLTVSGWALDRFNLNNLKSLDIIGSAEIAKGMLKSCTELKKLTIPFVGAENAADGTHFGYIFGADDASANPNFVPKSLKTVVITGGAAIDKQAFFGCASITDVILPVTVLTIGENAFEGCVALASVNIPARATKIGAGAFAGTAITDAAIPDSVSEIEARVFYDCKALKTISIGVGVTAIASDAFHGCDALDALYIKDVEKWCALDFADCYANPLFYARNLYVDKELVTELVIPESITEIKANSFYGCSNIEKVTFEGDVNMIGDYAFTSCISLCEIEMPEGLETIGRSAFSNCEALKSLVLPLGVESIGAYAFNLCDSLESVEIVGESMVGENAFRSCTALAELVVCNGAVVDITAFFGCENIMRASIAADLIANISKRALVELNVSGGEIAANALVGAARLEQVCLNGVDAIGAEAFSGCASLKSIELGETLSTVGAEAFGDCVRLTAITLPASVTAVDATAFDGCYRLVEVYNLTSLALDEALPYAKAIYTSADEASKLVANGSFVFFDNILIAYLGTDSVLTLPEGNYELGANALRGLDIVGLAVPDGITSYGENAFAECANLAEVVAPIAALAHIDGTTVTSLTVTGITELGKDALLGYEKLTALKLPKELTRIEDGALAGLVAIESITFTGECAAYTLIDGNLYTSDEKTLVRVMTNTDYFTVPKSVETIGAGAFAGCESISITFESEENLKAIGTGAFKGCTGLYSFTVFKSVTSISEGAFDGAAIEEIYVAEGNTVYSVNEDKQLVDKGGNVIWAPAADEN